MAGDGPILAEDGENLNGLSDGELNPQVSTEDSVAHSSFPFLDSGWGENAEARRADRFGHAVTPQRMGSLPDAPSPNRQKVSGQEERRKGGQASGGNTVSRYRIRVY